jgi:hypothetical protein
MYENKRSSRTIIIANITHWKWIQHKNFVNIRGNGLKNIDLEKRNGIKNIRVKRYFKMKIRINRKWSWKKNKI